MPIKLLALDLDGTTLTSERKLHPGAVDAVRRVREAGIQVVLASGRIRTSMFPFARELDLDGAMVSCNGAHVQGPGGAEIAHWPLPHAVFEAIWPYALEAGAHINVYTRDELLFLRESPFGLEYARRLRTIVPRVASVDEIREMEISKVLIMDHPERILEHRAEIEARMPGDLGRATLSEPDYLEFLAHGVSKARGLQVLCDRLGIDSSEVAAIGDYLNDREMLEWAGTSAVVANAHEDLVANARNVMRSNNEGGVAQFVEEFVLVSVESS